MKTSKKFQTISLLIASVGLLTALAIKPQVTKIDAQADPDSTVLLSAKQQVAYQKTTTNKLVNSKDSALQHQVEMKRAAAQAAAAAAKQATEDAANRKAQEEAAATTNSQAASTTTDSTASNEATTSEPTTATATVNQNQTTATVATTAQQATAAQPTNGLNIAGQHFAIGGSFTATSGNETVPTDTVYRWSVIPSVILVDAGYGAAHNAVVSLGTGSSVTIDGAQLSVSGIYQENWSSLNSNIGSTMSLMKQHRAVIQTCMSASDNPLIRLTFLD
ncbi:hypothetical protein [Lapidilactobacillus gannanensis]|uniref:Cell surface protein n=1 Tax=Lapidilactobacillus gannanensis TaxID=2486002 RepID=A0ABW4BLV9_9LACO|nr:hypothetical protein [Lapidilactobacillus gannanensis]